MNILKIYPITTADKVTNVTDVTGTLPESSSPHTLSAVLSAMKEAYNEKLLTPDETDSKAWSYAGNHITFGGLQASETYAEKSAYDLLQLILCPEIYPYTSGTYNVSWDVTPSVGWYTTHTAPTAPSVKLVSNLTFHNCKLGSYDDGTSWVYSNLTTGTAPSVNKSIDDNFNYVYKTNLILCSISPNGYDNTYIITSNNNDADKYFTSSEPNKRMASSSGAKKELLNTIMRLFETSKHTLKPLSVTLDSGTIKTCKVPHIIYKDMSTGAWVAEYLKGDVKDGNWVFIVPGGRNKDQNNVADTSIYISPCCKILSIKQADQTYMNTGMNANQFTRNFTDHYSIDGNGSLYFKINNDGTVTTADSSADGALLYTRYTLDNNLTEVATTKLNFTFKK